MITNIWLQLRWLLRFWILLVATTFTSAIFAYDGQYQTTVAYDSSRESAFDYDAVSVLAIGEKKNGTTGDHIPFAQFAEFLAAKAGVRAPDFIVSPGGTAFPVPKGASGPFPAQSGKGFQFTGGSGGNSLSPRTTDVRIMYPVTTGKYQYPGGYGSYGNAAGQTVNPFTGQTIPKSDPLWHIPTQ